MSAGRGALGLAHEVRTRWDVLLAIALGGALGSVARWSLVHALPPRSGAMPWATFLENLSGSLVLGAFMVLVLDVWPTRRYLRPFVGVGLLGGWTTFSTYALDTRGLLADGAPGLAFGYLAGTLVAGLAAAWAGVAIMRGLVAAAGARRRARATTGPTDRARTTEPTDRRR
jgi:CrcB protein